MSIHSNVKTNKGAEERPATTASGHIDKQARAAYLQRVTANFPSELRQAAQPLWVTWKLELRKNGAGVIEYTKVPHNARTGHKAGADKKPPEGDKPYETWPRKSWSTFNAACNGYLAVPVIPEDENKQQLPPVLADGLGVECAPESGLVFIDFDGCRNPATGAIAEWAQLVVATLIGSTYLEVSPSHKGLHGFTRGKLPDGKSGTSVRWPGPNGEKCAVEIYTCGRFFTVTGEKLEGAPSVIGACQEAIDMLYHSFLSADARKQRRGTHNSSKTLKASGKTQQQQQTVKPAETYGQTNFKHRLGWLASKQDTEIIQQLKQEFPKFARLWDGDTGNYGNDDSAADAALCCWLVRAVGDDAGRINDLFKRSSLYRPKWNTIHYNNGETYGAHTIQEAINYLTGGVQWARQVAEELTERLKKDSGAIFEPDSLDALNILAEEDPAEYQRLKEAARKRSVSVRELDAQRAKRKASTTSETEARTNSPYFASLGHGIYWRHTRSNGAAENTQLTDFTARIVVDRCEDDGLNQPRRVYELAAQWGVGEYKVFSVPAEDYGTLAWVDKHLGANARLMPGQSLKDYTRDAIKALSAPVPSETVYTHTGWRKIDEQWVYLHAGGGIGANGIVSGVKTSLPDALTRFVLPAPPERADLIAAIRASLGILDGLGSDEVIVPQYAAIWRATLGTPDFSLFSIGETSAKKSSVAALIQQHDGPEMTYNRLPLNWKSTANSLETALFHAKDVLVVIDEFKPTGTPIDKNRLYQTAENILRGHANGQGRARLNARSELMPTKYSRALPLGTGEENPIKEQSLGARVLFVEVPSKDSPDAINVENLTICQEDAEQGCYAQVKAAFVQWVAGRYETIQHRLKEQAKSLRGQARIPGQHDRTPGIIGDLGAGLAIFLDFAEAMGALTTHQRQALWRRAWQALCIVGAKQPEYQNEHRPEVQIRRLLASALAGKRAYLVTEDGTMPPNATKWGWMPSEYPDSNTLAHIAPSALRIGWVADDEQSIYLEPGTAYEMARTLAGKRGGDLTATQTTLAKRLHEHHLLKGTELSTRREYTVRRTLEGVRQKVWWVRADFISGETEIGPDPDSPPPDQHSDETSWSADCRPLVGIADQDHATKTEGGAISAEQPQHDMKPYSDRVVEDEKRIIGRNVGKNNNKGHAQEKNNIGSPIDVALEPPPVVKTADKPTTTSSARSVADLAMVGNAPPLLTTADQDAGQADHAVQVPDTTTYEQALQTTFGDAWRAWDTPNMREAFKARCAPADALSGKENGYPVAYTFEGLLKAAQKAQRANDRARLTELSRIAGAKGRLF